MVIGNEAVHAIRARRVVAARSPAWTWCGLGLERGASAAEALETIIALLERHGQGGDCGHRHRFYYHNSFLIADRARGLRPRDGRPLLGGRAGRAACAPSPTPSPSALARRGCRRTLSVRGSASFDFAAQLQRPGARRGRLRSDAAAARGGRSGRDPGRAADAIDSGGHDGHLARPRPCQAASADWSPERTIGRTLCMHAGAGDRRSQTVGSTGERTRRATGTSIG